jgi:RpiB/LacA/LacB family sugar-phosphate isomerase
VKIVVACDHAGFGLKDTVIQTIIEAGHEAIDLGTNSPESVDFPDFAEKGGQAIQKGEAERGVFICGSGIGVCISANKMKGIYASVCHDTYSAHQGVEHDDMNVLCLGGKIIGTELAKELVNSFLSARFNGKENQARRVNKIKVIESNN